MLGGCSGWQALTALREQDKISYELEAAGSDDGAFRSIGC